MDWNNINRDRDTSGLGPIEYDQSKVPALIRKHADNVRTKTYGQEVREAQARNAEIAGLIAQEAKDTSSSTETRQDLIEERYDVAVGEMTDYAEILDARVSSKGETHTNLKKRIDTEIETLNTASGENILNYTSFVPNRGVVANINLYDWTEAIKEAVRVASTKTSKKVIFPHIGMGEYLTKPIDFTAYKGITFVGVGANISANARYLWGDENKDTDFVRITFTESADYGFEFAKSKNPVTPIEFNSGQFLLKNLWLNGNNLVQNVVNGNYSFTLSHMMITGGINDGVVLEDGTYPALIEDSQLGPNGRHGLFARGPITTSYFLNRVNSSLNGGYGYLLEGGSGAAFNDCLAQSNTQGGLKISKRNDLYGRLASNWLEKLTFNNFYTEGNGKLAVDDPNYEGNYALVIEGVGNTNVTNAIEPRYIKFINGSLNAGMNGGTYNIKRVYGLSFTETNVDHSKGKIDVTQSTGLKTTSVATKSNSIAPFPFNSSYQAKDRDTTLKVETNGGTISKRGRIHAIPFKASAVTASYNKDMKIAYMSEIGDGLFRQGYPIVKGSIVGIKLMARNGSGIITASVTKGAIIGGSGQTWWISDTLALDTSKTISAEKWFEPLEYLVDNSTVGIRISTTSNYTNDTPIIIGYLLVEE